MSEKTKTIRWTCKECRKTAAMRFVVGDAVGESFAVHAGEGLMAKHAEECSGKVVVKRVED
jgi:hypothetical protein